VESTEFKEYITHQSIQAVFRQSGSAQPDLAGLQF